MRTCGLVAAVLALGSTQPLRAASTAFSGRLILGLDDAVCQPQVEGQPPELRPIDVFATYEEGEWTDVWGQSQEFIRALYTGHRTTAQVSAGRIVLTTTLHIPDGPYGDRGGVGQYEIDLSRTPPAGLCYGDEELQRARSAESSRAQLAR